MSYFDYFEMNLHSPKTSGDWAKITDKNMEHTTAVTFHIEGGKEVEFVKVKHGRWKLFKIGGAGYPFWDNVCSICDWKTSRVGACDYKFCPNCGAKMDEKEEA